MNREINTLSIKGLLDKRFWVIIVFYVDFACLCGN